MVRHIRVYGENGVYAGWPANHGAWQWGDELLVGFMRGPYDREGNGMHSIGQPYQKVHARSLDGGESWSVEVPNLDFECVRPTIPPSFSLSDSIIRVCGNYDTGGESCVSEGGFYLSSDHGHVWEGPFLFGGPVFKIFTGPNWNTSRTRVLGDLVFLSAARSDQWGSDSILVAKHGPSGFDLVGVVANDSFRAVMPAVAKIGSDLFVAARRKGTRGNWIDVYRSGDCGKTWNLTGMAGETGNHNGNPPALAARDGVLYCAFADRSLMGILLSSSRDYGATWSVKVLRYGTSSDIGYPQMFVRGDGNLACVYYWADDENRNQGIECSIFDPEDFTA